MCKLSSQEIRKESHESCLGCTDPGDSTCSSICPCQRQKFRLLMLRLHPEALLQAVQRLQILVWSNDTSKFLRPQRSLRNWGS